MARRRLNGSVHDDVINGYSRSETIYGGYGDDIISGNGGNDRLDGGRGNDVLDGGRGNDVIISRSDGGEPEIAQEINANNDPNGEVDAASRRIYSNQANLPADDILTGGPGADHFVIRPLINAKREILEKHADPRTGKIDYSMNGVAGENNNVHDHWVDSIGNDIITDFNKAEGDKLTIAGHTTEVYKIEVKDVDGNGQDDTILHLRSNQGANGGAHHLDLLGTVTVLNNVLTENDFTVDPTVHYGIVENISQLNEAINPLNPRGSSSNPPNPVDPVEDPIDDENPVDPVDPTDPVDSADPVDPVEDPVNGEDPVDPVDLEDSVDPVDPAPSLGSVLESLFAPPADAAPGAPATQGDDVLIYTDGNDQGDGGRGNDLMLGGNGNDLLFGGAGDDLIDGGAGNDRLFGGHGDDIISGADGNDIIMGGFGDDILHGGAGNDRIWGGRGDDVLIGGDGDDIMWGGVGDDVFVAGAGNNTINGGAGTDAMLLAGSIEDYDINVNGARVLITDSNGDTDVVSRVELFHFTGSGETYALANGRLTPTANTEDLEDLLSDDIVSGLISEELGNDVDVVELDQLAPADDEVDAGVDQEAEADPPAEVDVPAGADAEVDHSGHLIAA